MSFPLRIFAIDREVFVGDAKSVSLPSATGQIQILPGHAPLISKLAEGDVVIEPAAGGEEKLPISGGVVEVKPNETVVLVNFQ